MSTKQVGDLGEKIAEDFLKNEDYQILEKNYCFRIPGSPQKGEIDIIVRKNGIISFVEVKALKRKNRERVSDISPEEKVNFSKQRKLIKTAETWLMKKKIPLNSKWQIDIISIELSRDKETKINHFKNAVPCC